MTSTLSQIAPFHLAFPVSDLNATRSFYGGLLGCREGRSSDHWIDFDLFGHQIVAHLVEATSEAGLDDSSPCNLTPDAATNSVDGHNVPVPHFGVVLSWEQWHAFADRLKSVNLPFAIEPHIRFEGQVGEQATMFFRDPSGNALEFKAFRDPSRLFAV